MLPQPPGYVLSVDVAENTRLMELQRGRTCTPRSRSSHAVQPSYLINCKKCHSAKCFWHILDGNVHSSEALLASAADPSSAIWHQIHQMARRRDVTQHRTQGQPVDVAERFLFFALKFSGTSPVSGETSVGFYDGHGPQVGLFSVVYTDQR